MSFYMRTSTKEPSNGLLTFDHDLTLGNHTDIDGNRWNIAGLYRKDGVWSIAACPQDQLHPYYTDTTTDCFNHGTVRQKWSAYEVEIKKDNKS